MKAISNFDEFKHAVINEVNSTSSFVPRSAFGGVLGLICTPIASMLNSHGAAISPSIGLNSAIYFDCLEKDYKQRYEEHKKDNQYVQSLITEAANKLRTIL